MTTEPSPTPTVQPDGAPEIRDAGTAGARPTTRVSDKIRPGPRPKPRSLVGPKRKAAHAAREKAAKAAKG